MKIIFECVCVRDREQGEYGTGVGGRLTTIFLYFLIVEPCEDILDHIL